MHRSKICLLIVSLFTFFNAVSADTFVVNTFEEEFINWATAHVDTFEFPSDDMAVSNITMEITLGCPSSPGDCDPWDRLGKLEVIHDTGEVDSIGAPITEYFELGRFITPYDITGGNYPGTCTWTLDVTDYQIMLQNSVVLSLFIESWIGGDRGWLVTIDFVYTTGVTELVPYEIVNLYKTGYLLIGNPNYPVEDFLYPKDIYIEPDVDSAYVRVITTGHGQGNTLNAAEFSQLNHTVVANEVSYTWLLWRYDCAQNECSPQGGTWTYNRAGWCPGDAVYPEDINIMAALTPGDTLEFDYNLQDYENCCRTDNPDCTGQYPCCVFGDCNNYQPIYHMSVQLILFKSVCEGPWSVGDANNDGYLDILDIISVISIITSPQDFSKCEHLISDYNQDGEVSIVDVINLVSAIIASATG